MPTNPGQSPAGSPAKPITPARPRVLIGTLSCGEGDFEECRRSVAAQTYPCEQYVIQDLPEPEANYRLYRTFADSSADCLIRLDADMVFKDKTALAGIIARVAGTSWHKVSHLVDDFFTGKPMMGVHCYTRAVEFDWAAFKTGELYPDRRNSVMRLPAAERSKVWKVYDAPGDTPVWHCRWTTEPQAFHFGYHRWIKHQHDTCRAVLDNYRAHPAEPRLELACLGMLAAAKRPTHAAASYGPEFQGIYQDALRERGDARRTIEALDRALIAVKAKSAA